MKLKNIWFLQLFIATFLLILFQEINADYIGSYDNNRWGIVYTADEPSYLAPPRNWLQNGTWKDNSSGVSSYVQRSPGYGIIYLVNLFLWGKWSYLGLKLTQILGFVGTLWFAQRFLSSLKMSLHWLWPVVVLPCYSGFVYYGLTESITPFFVISCAYYALALRDCEFRRSVSLVVFCGVLSFLLLLRPQLLPLIIAIWIPLFYRLDKGWNKVLLVSIFLPFFVWTLRTYKFTGELSMHPIYHATNETIWRAPHEELGEIYKIWECDGEKFHGHVGRLASGDSSVLHEIQKDIPANVFPKLKPVLVNYQVVLKLQHEMGLTKHFLKKEASLVDEMRLLKSDIKRENKWSYYVLTPLKSAKQLLSRSHLNLFIFQSTWRGNWLMEFTRIVCLGILVFSCLLAVSLWSIRKADALLRWMSLGIFGYFFYLVYVQRMNEERYLTPLLILAYLLAAYFIKRFVDRSHLQA